MGRWFLILIPIISLSFPLFASSEAKHGHSVSKVKNFIKEFNLRWDSLKSVDNDSDDSEALNAISEFEGSAADLDSYIYSARSEVDWIINQIKEQEWRPSRKVRNVWMHLDEWVRDGWIYATEPANRPISVPRIAKWNPDENEWELGGHNKDGYVTGVWKWWLAPKGHLVARTIFSGEYGENLSYTRFHPDGTPSRKGKISSGDNIGTAIYIKSREPSDEVFAVPSSAEGYDTLWKAELTYDNFGEIEKERYFAEDGSQLEFRFYK